MNILSYRNHKALAVISLLLGGAVWEGLGFEGGVESQCPRLRAVMQKRSGFAQKAKVGSACGTCPDSGPPRYYLEYGNGLVKTADYYMNQPCDTYTTTWRFRSGSFTVIADDNPNQSDTNPCDHTGVVVAQGVDGDDEYGTYDFPYTCKSPGPPGGCGCSSYHLQGTYRKVDGVVVQQDPDYYSVGVPSSNPDSTETVVTCSNTSTKKTWHTVFGPPDPDVILDQTWTEINGSYRINEYTTSMLESKTLSIAAANLSATFADGNAISSRFLSGDESCASASKAIYRIKIPGYVPLRKYILKFDKTVEHYNGSKQTTTFRKNVTAPASGEWYYPGVNGEPLPDVGWAPGACTQGGTESITYSNATIEEK